MAIVAFPYDSQLTDGKYDRAINSATYRKLLSKYFTTGVFPNPSTQFQVYATTGLNLTVKAGSANIEGVFVQMDTDQSITIETASSQPRIDRVVLKHDDSQEVRAVTLEVKKGTPASNPQAQALERTSSVYEIALADVYVGASATSISQSNITDVRLDSNLCGIVSATITSIDTTTFFEQMTDDFNTWFEGIKGTLGEDTAGNLLNLINEIKETYVPKTDIVNDLTTGGTDKPLSAEQGKVLKERDGVAKIIAIGSLTCSYQDTNFLAGTINMSGYSLQTDKHKVFLEIRYVAGSAMDFVVEKKYTLNSNSIKVELRGNGGFVNGQLCEVSYIVVEKVD